MGVAGHLLEVVGGEEDGHPFPGQLLEKAVDELHPLGVQAGGGLVQDEDLGAVEDGRGQAQALPLPQGVPLHLLVGHRQELEPGEDLADAGLVFHPGEPGVHPEVLPAREVGVKGGRGLHHRPQVAAGGGAFVDVLPEEEGPAFRGEGEAGGQADEGGLAAPVGPRQGVDLPGRTERLTPSKTGLRP